MNLVLAWIILFIGFSIGMSPIVSDAKSIPGKRLSNKIVVANVVSGSPAEEAGIKAGDTLLSMSQSGDPVVFDDSEEVINFTGPRLGQEIKIQLKDDKGSFEKTAKLSEDEEAPLGLEMIDETIIRVPVYKAPYYALRETYKITELTGKFFGNFFATLFTSGKVNEGVGGPVAIYVYTGFAVEAGIMILLQFIAILSVNLALVNILPFPSLDGGRIVFIILERIFGKKIVKEKVENIIHTVGFALLILLIIAVTYRDIVTRF
jgi:regulator of sigma E protease